jgi:DNA primase
MEAVTLTQIEAYDPQPMRAGGRTRYACPLSPVCREKPHDNAHRSLCVENDTGFFYCHRCAAKGRLREFWEKKAGLKPPQKPRYIRPAAAPKIITKPAPEKKAELRALRERMALYADQFAGSAAQDYLQRRGIPAKISAAAGCGFAPSWEHWEKKSADWNLLGADRRVVFPVFDEGKNLAAIHGRAIDEGCINSSKITKGNKSLGVFLSSPEVFLQPAIAICEGPVDALALEACGLPALAMIGTSAPAWLAERLLNKAVLLTTDADKAGDEAAAKLERALRSYTRKILRLRPPSAKDWAEELEQTGAENMRAELAPFAPGADDVTRANSSWRYAQEGDHETAEFISRLIDDKELRDAFLVLIRKEHLMAA